MNPTATAAAECVHWSPNPYQMQVGQPSTTIQCLNCGGVWDAHAKRPAVYSGRPVPKTGVKFGGALSSSPSTPPAPLPVTSYTPSGVSINVMLRRVMVPGIARTTLGFGAMEKGGPNGIRWHNVAVLIDASANPLGRIEAALGTLTGSMGVEVAVPSDRILAISDEHALFPAVYTGETTGVAGKARPTLIQGQGVVVVQMDSSAGVARVMCDPTDPKAGEVQWPSRTVITDVPTSQLVSNANWRNWRGPNYPGWLTERTFVNNTIVPNAVGSRP